MHFDDVLENFGNGIRGTDVLIFAVVWITAWIQEIFKDF